MIEKALHNIEKARRIEYDIFPQCKKNVEGGIVESIIEDYPLVKQGDYRYLPRIVELYFDDWHRIISYIDVILQLLKDNPMYEDIPEGNIYDVIDYFEEGIKAYVGNRKMALNGIQYGQCNDYIIKPIENFSDAADYKEFVDWCITEGQSDYEEYTDGGELFYFCMRPGFEKEPKLVKDGFPWDEYGMSLFAVSVNRHGLIANVTSRWNIDSNGIHKIDDETLSRMIGRNCYEILVPREIS